jgi:hypothetical protein
MPETEIFLVVEGQRGEDYSGRRCTDFIFDEYDNIGYFTSRESAQAWVDEQQSEGNAAYQEALKTYPSRLKAFQTRQRNHRAKEDEITARAKAANVPYTRKHFYGSAPHEPTLGEYVKTEYEIWEVRPHV